MTTAETIAVLLLAAACLAQVFFVGAFLREIRRK